MAEFYSARGWEIPPLPWTNTSERRSQVKPYVVKDIGSTAPYTLSRHKSDLAARRAICKYRRMALNATAQKEYELVTHEMRKYGTISQKVLDDVAHEVIEL